MKRDTGGADGAGGGRGPGRLPAIALACAVLGFPLAALSYSWIPFARAGREMGTLGFLPPAAEIAALLAGLAAISLGIMGRRRAPAGTEARRKAALALALGAALLAAIVLPNVITVLLLGH